MRQIPADEVVFHPHSFGDPAGRLFSWRDSMYRGITPAWAPFFESLLREPLIRKLMAERLLIETEVAPLCLPPFALVVRHPHVPFPSYAEEWCPAMLRDGALAVLNLALRLAGDGFMLKDGHCWNLLFEGIQPRYVDVTSIAPIDGAVTWPAADEFMRFFVNPLLLMEHGLDRVARRTLPHGHGVLGSEVAALTGGTVHRPLDAFRRRVRSLALQGRAVVRRRLAGSRRIPQDRRAPTPSSYREELRAALRLVERISPPADRAYRWVGARRRAATPPGEAGWPGLGSVLQQLRPDTIAVVEGPSCLAAHYAARLGVPVVSLRADPDAVTREYQETRARGLPLLPLVVDFADPTPSRGIDGHSTIGAIERLGGQLVIGPGRLPPVAAERHLRPELVVRGLAAFARRWLVLYGVPRGQDTKGVEQGGCDDGWHLGAVAAAARRQFGRVESLPIDGRDAVVLVCER